MSDKILEGIRVVDLTRVLTGPFCAMMLGDMGADVIKVERPGHGDDTRKWGPPFIGEESAYFMSINRNKRSITINMKDEAGKAILWKLIESADILIENFRPGTMKKLGFDYETVKERNPKIVYGSISGFGQTGPASGLTAYDLIVQGMSGQMTITGPPDSPTKFGTPIADLAAGMFNAYAVMAALFHREKTGVGQYIDTSMLGGQLALLSYHAGKYFATQKVPKSSWNAHGIVGPYQTFKTKDGHVNIANGNDAIWQRFCQALGFDDLANDPKYTENPGRMADLKTLVGRIEEKFADMESATVLELLDKAGVPAGPIYNLEETFNQPQVEAYNLRRTIEHPTVGELDQLGFPYLLSETPADIYLPPPTLGQHTAEILGEYGYSAEEIGRLQESGAV